MKLSEEGVTLEDIRNLIQPQKIVYGVDFELQTSNGKLIGWRGIGGGFDITEKEGVDCLFYYINDALNILIEDFGDADNYILQPTIGYYPHKKSLLKLQFDPYKLNLGYYEIIELAFSSPT